MAAGDGEGEVSFFVSFLVVSFFVVPVEAFLVDAFLVVEVWVLAGDFSGAVVVVDVSVLLVQELISPAINKTVME